MAIGTASAPPASPLEVVVGATEDFLRLKVEDNFLLMNDSLRPVAAVVAPPGEHPLNKDVGGDGGGAGRRSLEIRLIIFSLKFPILRLMDARCTIRR